MVTKEYNGKLLDVTTVTASVGNWWTPMESWHEPTMPVSIQLKAGTGTWTLEGRNGPNDTAETLDTGTASKVTTVPAFREFRLSVSGGTGLTLRGSIPVPIRQTA